MVHRYSPNALVDCTETAPKTMHTDETMSSRLAVSVIQTSRTLCLKQHGHVNKEFLGDAISANKGLDEIQVPDETLLWCVIHFLRCHISHIYSLARVVFFLVSSCFFWVI